ncbi:uncharacterized [Tachysurus ichikawai]
MQEQDNAFGNRAKNLALISSTSLCTSQSYQQGAILDDKVAKHWVLMLEVAVEKRKSRPCSPPPPPPPPAAAAASPAAGLAINNSKEMLLF